MLSFACRASTDVIVENEDMATGMEKKEHENSPDIFWSREPIMGHRGTKENPAIVPSFNDSRVVGLETEQVRMHCRPVRARERATGQLLFAADRQLPLHTPGQGVWPPLLCVASLTGFFTGLLLLLLLLLRVSSGSGSRRARCTSSPTSTSS